MIIEQEQLLSMLGYDNVGCAEKCLKKQGVAVIYGKEGRISTTLDALNQVLLKIKSKPPIEID